MEILVINSGSSSIKVAVVNHETGKQAVAAKAQRVGTDRANWTLNGGEPHEPAGSTPKKILEEMLPAVLDACQETPKGVAHRVVHGGTEFTRPVRISDEVLAKIEKLAELAPLHNPPNAAGIRAARELLPDLPHVAVFDTAFHGTLPTRAKNYAIRQDIAEKHNVLRFGFHGPSHEYVAKEAAHYMGADLNNLRVITLHLGNGCSAAAVEYGRSVETSMGMTPLEGLVMGTRSGDIDPGAMIAVAREEGWDFDELDDFLNRESGLAGLSRVGNDLRDIEDRAAEGDENCRLAIQVFAHRVRKYVGAYAAVMGGVDAIVFTAGIGQNSALMRHRIAQRLDFLGARIDEDANQHIRLTEDEPVQEISEPHSRCKLLVAITDEQHAIAKEAVSLVAERDKVSGERTIPIAISARHVHLTQEMVEKLFGEGHELTPAKDLSQPGQFASEEKVTLHGPKRSIEGVRILGPARGYNQVEISRTDEFFLGVDAPVRRSGDVENTPGIVIEGPEGKEKLEDGVICAWRHIHMTPEDADSFDVEDGDLVEVAIEDTSRGLIFGDVLVRVKPSYKLEMHIDTDEGNAAELPPFSEGVLMATEGHATLRRKRPRE
jgi:acetate kinase